MKLERFSISTSDSNIAVSPGHGVCAVLKRVWLSMDREAVTLVTCGCAQVTALRAGRQARAAAVAPCARVNWLKGSCGYVRQLGELPPPRHAFWVSVAR